MLRLTLPRVRLLDLLVIVLHGVASVLLLVVVVAFIVGLPCAYTSVSLPSNGFMCYCFGHVCMSLSCTGLQLGSIVHHAVIWVTRFGYMDKV